MLLICEISRRLMFIADTTRIVRATMSGRDVNPLVSEAVYRANGIAVDLVTQRVFWCDSLLDYIETVDYRGANRHFVIRGIYTFTYYLHTKSLNEMHNMNVISVKIACGTSYLGLL